MRGCSRLPKVGFRVQILQALISAMSAPNRTQNGPIGINGVHLILPTEP